ncbi:alpha/beta hydrolase [Bordetella petrii]|uniref:alpha/beta hydrolase n=1 Tax=Bordetella petrii TaxID=94624 RepID=UPI001E547C8A|nr:alpha/beta hydrolase [Bordetella petrii]MCD0501875.1 alpha/beta hydrolase [Bordetella petrii]
MTAYQFDLIARLLGIAAPTRAAARAVLIDNQAPAAAARLQGCAERELEAAVEQMQALELEIRGAFVLHGPTEFRVTVGHADSHRMPGAAAPAVGQVVRLVAHSTERWIPVRVLAAPDTPGGYYEGVIVEQLVKASRFQAGDRARFGEDQVMHPDSSARPGIPGRLNPRFRGRQT